MNLLQILFGSKVTPAAAENSDSDDLPHLNVKIEDSPRFATHFAANAAPHPEIETEGIPSVNRRRGNNRIVNIGGFIAILVVGIAAFAVVNPDKAAKKTITSDEQRISNTLPPLMLATTAPPPTTRYVVPAILQSDAHESPAQPIALRGQSAPALDINAASSSGSAPGTKNPTPDWLSRKMSGGLLVASNAQTGSATLPAESSTATHASGNTRSPLALTLEPTLTTGVSASMLPDRNFLITKGTSLDCALETALDSTLPGLTTCRVTRDVYSDNGQVLLMDRGSKVVGEYQGGIKQGQVRMGVLWTRVETPLGVVVSLDSPGTDALGRTGLEGWVDDHFAQRFGAAILMSFLQDSVAALLARQTPVNGTVVVGSTAATAGEKIVEKILDSTVNIAPTLVKNHGDHIQIMVARDLDFSSVYALRMKH